MQIRGMDAYEMITELRRCRAVAERNVGRTDPNPAIQDGWKISADRHAERAAKLTEAAKASIDPEIPRWLDFYGFTL